ncbi:MAG: hypothetical protein ACK4N5_03775, partial [Myxococcales bacterium]
MRAAPLLTCLLLLCGAAPPVAAVRVREGGASLRSAPAAKPSARLRGGVVVPVEEVRGRFARVL